MARTYVRTHVGLMDDEDYAALSTTGKAGWHTLNMLQGKQTEERFKNHAQLALLLRREGFDDPAAVLQELEANRWIIPDDGGIALKGFSKWQAPKRNQYMQDYRAARNSNEPARAESPSITYHTVTSPTVPSRPAPALERVNPDDVPFYGAHSSCKVGGPHYHPKGEYQSVG